MKRNQWLLLSIFCFTIFSLPAQDHLEVEGDATIQGRLALGQGNIFLGASSGQAITTGNFNMFFGNSSGQATTEGRLNSFFGISTGFSNTTGDHNTFLGANAGYFNDTSSYNIALGSDALRQNTRLSKNLAIGVDALRNLVRGDGFELDSTDTGASYNLAIGHRAGYNTNGAIITAPKSPNARGEITESGAHRNTFVGHLSAHDNDDGHSNTYVGFAAGYENQRNYNTIIGTEAGQKSSSGSNVFVGHRAGYEGTGFSNVFVGKGAGMSGSSSHSVFLGFHAGLSSTGTSNTFVGSESGLSTEMGVENVFLGELAGSTNKDGDYNTLIGASADVADSSLLRATAIGYNSQVDCSDCLILGSSQVRPNVGIGISDPAQRLHVVKTPVSGISYNANSIALFESNSSGYLSVLTPDNQESGVLFGNPTSAEAGGIVYNNPASEKGLEFRTNGNLTRMVIDSFGRIRINNATNPASTSPANAVQLFAQDEANSAELRVRDEAGNITTLSPHNFSLMGEASEPMAWSFYSENDQGSINVDMLKTIRLVEELSGEKLVYIQHKEPQADVQHDAGMPGLKEKVEQLQRENQVLKEELVRIKKLLGIE